MSVPPLILYEKRGHVSIFTLNRPEAMNAVNRNLAERFTELLDQFEADEEAWVGILASSHSKVFCAGADLKAVSKGGKLTSDKGGFAGFVNYPRSKPFIACVDGLALAGGCELTLACDLIVASTKSQFGLPEVKRSLVAAAGGLYRLPRKLPQNIALELLLTGDQMSAERMHHFGYVNVLTEPEKTMEAALKLADRIVVNAPLAVRLARELVFKCLRTNSEIEHVNLSNSTFPVLAETEDFREGPRAFIEKRSPRWTGRKAHL